jgi:hypothetical protein
VARWGDLDKGLDHKLRRFKDFLSGFCCEAAGRHKSRQKGREMPQGRTGHMAPTPPPSTSFRNDPDAGSSTMTARDVVHLVSGEDAQEGQRYDGAESMRPPLREHLSADSSSTASALDSTRDEWREWIAKYAEGDWAGSVAPAPPLDIVAAMGPKPQTRPKSDSATAETSTAGQDAVRSDASVPISTMATSTTARDIASSEGFVVLPESSFSSGSSGRPSDAQAVQLLDFYRQHGYLPGPKSTHEHERLRIMKRFRLDEKDRKRSISRICQLVRSHFQSSTVIITRASCATYFSHLSPPS